MTAGATTRLNLSRMNGEFTKSLIRHNAKHCPNGPPIKWTHGIVSTLFNSSASLRNAKDCSALDEP